MICFILCGISCPPPHILHEQKQTCWFFTTSCGRDAGPAKFCSLCGQRGRQALSRKALSASNSTHSGPSFLFKTKPTPYLHIWEAIWWWGALGFQTKLFALRRHQEEIIISRVVYGSKRARNECCSGFQNRTSVIESVRVQNYIEKCYLDFIARWEITIELIDACPRVILYLCGQIFGRSGKKPRPQNSQECT